jgi:hypothetical protein
MLGSQFAAFKGDEVLRLEIEIFENCHAKSPRLVTSFCTNLGPLLTC